MGLSLVRIAWVKGEGDEPTLQVMAERADTRQLLMDDCVKLSHRISDKFDAMEEAGNDPIDYAYRLEVSSPGIDRPLTRFSDYIDWSGHEAKVELAEAMDGQRRYRGTIIEARREDEIVRLEDKAGKCYDLPYSQIDNAKLVLTDRLLAQSAPIDMTGADEIEDSEDDEEVTD